MTAGDKTPRRLETRRRVEQKSQARNPSAGLERELDERVARDEERWLRSELEWARSMVQCAHYRDGGVCSTRDCWVEPACIVDQPTEGWDAEIARLSELLKDAPSAKAPTSVARDAPSSTTPERRSRKEG